jgi:hypothetical protein
LSLVVEVSKRGSDTPDAQQIGKMRRGFSQSVRWSRPRRGGRLGCLIASTLVVAALQRAVDEARPLFLLKGGMLLQHRLGLDAGATSDIDGLVRGDLTRFLVVLDEVIEEPWGPLGIERGPVEYIKTPSRITKPMRFSVKVRVGTTIWRRVQVEVAPDEGGAGDSFEVVNQLTGGRSPPLTTRSLPWRRS